MTLKITKHAAENDRHSQDIYALVFHNGKLYSSAVDGKVKVWNTDLVLEKEFQAHESVVYDLAIIGNTLYTCSNDGTVKSWDAESFQAKTTLLRCEDEVYKLYVDNGNLYGGDDKGIVRLWRNDKVALFWNLVEEVRGLVIIDNLIFTVRDRDLVITETAINGRFSTRKTIVGSSPLCKAGRKICFTTRSGTDILVIDSSKDTLFKELAEMKGHSMIINTLKGFGDSVLYSGSYDKSVKQWDLNSYSCVSSCDTGECINTLTVGNEGEVYAGGSNGFLCCIKH